MLKKALQSLCWNYKKKLEVGYEKAAASASTDIGMPVSGMDYDIRFSIGLLLIVIIIVTNLSLNLIKNRIGNNDGNKKKNKRSAS